MRERRTCTCRSCVMQTRVSMHVRREDGTVAVSFVFFFTSGWKMHDALRVVNGVRDLDVYIEQPCLSYEECVSVRRMCPLPFVIDESMDDIGMLTRIIADKSADLINLKISKVLCF